MGASDRIVRHLRLRADSEAHVRRAVSHLEDALRCASLPDADRRVLLVRRLNLGRIPANASSQTLSLLLEQRVSDVGGSWMHGADLGAADADLVFFRDLLEARTQLALQLAKGMACTDWYWPLAVPEFKPAESVQANLRNIALAIAALAEAPAALPAWIADLMFAGLANVLANVMGPVEVASLLRAARLSTSTLRRLTAQNASVQSGIASSSQDIDETTALPRREVSPAFRALPAWLQTLALRGGFVPPLVSVAPPVHAAQIAADGTPTSVEQNQQQVADDELPSAIAEPDNDTGHERTLLPEHVEADTSLHDATEHALPEKETETVLKKASINRPYLDATPSAYGGLLFLLPVLHRLGYANWAENLPEGVAAQVAQQMMSMVLQRLRAPSDDPAWTLVSSNANDDSDSIDVPMPAMWSAPSPRPPRGNSSRDIPTLAQQRQSVATLAQIWLIVCRRWLRRVAGIGVATLVMRPASIGLTTTHADVFFRLGDVDMRVRRAGLDFDPGWLTWYGRVVSFHYGLEMLP